MEVRRKPPFLVDSIMDNDNKILLIKKDKSKKGFYAKKKTIAVIEITGAPCSGKTSFINNNFVDKAILLSGMPVSYGIAKRLLFSFFLSFYALATGSISLRQTWWLVKKAGTYDETLFSRLNAFRNSMLKFGYHLFKLMQNTMLVDEGISHIPFILGLSSSDIVEFIKIFRNHLEKVEIAFVESPTKEELKARLILRGHKRVRNVSDIESFVEKNINIGEKYKGALCNADLRVTFINDFCKCNFHKADIENITASNE